MSTVTRRAPQSLVVSSAFSTSSPQRRYSSTAQGPGLDMDVRYWRLPGTLLAVVAPIRPKHVEWQDILTETHFFGFPNPTVRLEGLHGL